MVVYTERGLRRISLQYNLYSDELEKATLDDLRGALDYAEYQQQYYLDLAWTIADRLKCKPTWKRAPTSNEVQAAKAAYKKWRTGTATASDMVFAMDYCCYQSDAWADEIEIMSELIHAEEKKLYHAQEVTT